MEPPPVFVDALPALAKAAENNDELLLLLPLPSAEGGC
jgi:hypothetical protein